MSYTLRPITEEEYEEARALWDVVFPEDALGYSAYYFRARTRPAYVLAAFDGERMVGDLHAIPYPLRFGDTVKPCAMVAGVATLPEYRHKGIAGSLIRFAHERLREEGAAAALLKPDVDFYAQFGYLPFAYHDVYEMDAEKAAGMHKSAPHEPDPAAMLAIYEDFAKDFTGMMARTRRDMKAYIEEARLSGFAAADAAAYALCAREDDGVSVTELVGKNPLPLVCALAEEYGRAEFRLPSAMRIEGLAPKRRMMFSMICPLDEEKLLSGTGASGVRALLDGETGSCCTLEFC